MNSNEWTVIGLVRSTGEFEGFTYDNTTFHCSRPANETKGGIGSVVAAFKIKTNKLDFEPEIGQVISPYFDQFKNVDYIRLI